MDVNMELKSVCFGAKGKLNTLGAALTHRRLCVLSLGWDLAAPGATRAGKQECSRVTVTVPSPAAAAAGQTCGVKGRKGKKPLQAQFHSGRELGSEYTPFRWEVGRLPRGNPQYFERQQIVSYKLKNQNARSELEARIYFFFPCFLFFLQHDGKGNAGLLSEGKDGSTGEQVIPRIP